MSIESMFKEIEEEIINDRKWFHQHPELSLQEKETSKRICEILSELNVEYEVIKPNYGIIATVCGRLGEGKNIVLRADIDALPVVEDTELEYKSLNCGVMHACGHDAHIAMLLGAVRVIKRNEDKFSGTVKFLFQVAEEIGKGCDEIIEYLKKDNKDYIFGGLHIWSTIEEGEIVLLPGAIFAGGCGFNIDIVGRGGHGARPDLVNDPIKAACDLVNQMSMIPSNYYDVLDHSVVSICKIEAGTAGNIFPSNAKLSGSFRFYKVEALEKIKNIIERIARGVGITHNVECKVNYLGSVPPIINNDKLISMAKNVVGTIEGLEVSKQTDPISASDNYGFFIEEYDGIYAVIGGGKKGEEVYPQHHPKFDIDNSALVKGSEFLCKFALKYLENQE